jgi:NitT/TauT family transport system substrate-binding protein
VHIPSRGGVAAALIASALAMAVAACGSDDEPSSKAAGAAATGPEKIKIALYPSTDYPALYIGIKQGIFKKHGLEPEVTQVLTGTGLTAAITSGQADIGTNSPTSMATGISNNLPVQMVTAVDNVPTEGYVEVLVKKDSPIKGWGDLAGKQVATVNLQGLFDLGVRNAVEKAGGDPKSLKTLAMDPTDEGPALAAGRVDAIALQDPFLAQAKANPKFRSLGNPFADLGYPVQVGAFWASKTTIAKKPELLKKFKAAMDEATKIAAADETLVRETIPTYTQLKPEVANQIGLPVYSTEASQDGLDKMTAQMQSYGWIKSAPTFDQIVWGGAAG